MNKNNNDDSGLPHELAARTMEIQIRSLQESVKGLDGDFNHAVDLVATASKVVTTGLGKSSFIARKMAATLSSIRQPAVYIHPVDALHGDSGILGSDDILVAFSKSGETAEVVRIVRLAKDLGLKVVAIVGRKECTLTELANAAIVASVVSEFDEDNIIPTTSTTTSLVLADLLAVSAAKVRGNVVDQLKRSHPDGSIGSGLLRTVDEVMHSGTDMPRVSKDATLAEALEALSSTRLGVVCICDDREFLLGIITDGDIRKLAGRQTDFNSVHVQSVMTTEPVTVQTDATLHEALQVMERRERQLNVVPVLSGKRCVGVLRLHDVVRANV